MELVGPKKRNLCGTTPSIAFGFGGVIVAAITYFVPWNAQMLQLVFVCLSLPLFGYWGMADESIPWLWEQRRTEEAMGLLEKAAKINGIKLVSFPENFQCDNIPSNNNNDRRPSLASIAPIIKATFLDVFRTPQIRKRIIVMMYAWFATGVLYFGLSFNSVDLFGNPFLTFTITCLAELPAHPITIFLTPKTGHKPMLCVNMLFSGVACVVLAFLSRGK